MKKLCGLIPAAGKGTRAYPYTKKIPKSMLEINGVPNILRNILLMRDSLGITDIFVVVGYQGHVIKEFLGDGKQYNINLTYIENSHVEKGLAYSVLLAKQYITDYFLMMLSDECYIDTNHEEFLSSQFNDALATLSVMEVDDRELIKNNYSIETEGDRVTRLIEKPTLVNNKFLGCGTFIFHPDIFRYIGESFENSKNESVDLITLIDRLCREGKTVRHFKLRGRYVNINDRDSLQLAKYYERDKDFSQKNISLLIYSEGNEKDIIYTIRQYKKSEEISNIYVLLPDQNSVEEDVKAIDVPVIKCPAHVIQYGEKIKYGLSRIPGDIFILTEANYSFSYQDIPKLLVYLREADMVIGTRTTRQLIQQRSYMRGVVRLANVMLAKMLELLWWNFECRFSDVGCTFRALWKSTFFKIKNNLDSRGPEFSVEMTIEILRARDKIIEIPVNYFGRSYSLYEKHQNLKTFFKMLYVIGLKGIRHRLRD